MFCVSYIQIYRVCVCVVSVVYCGVCVGVSGVKRGQVTGAENSYIKLCSPKFISSLISKDTSQQHRQAVNITKQTKLKKSFKDFSKILDIGGEVVIW